jgi:histidinol-phosphate/aromatic aminotransferase/cobyric acid decarboxylase-like protein
MHGFGLPNAIRVTVSLREHNERFLKAMKCILENAGKQSNSPDE